MSLTERWPRSIEPELAWLVAAVTGALALVGGSALLPRQVYDGFVWRHFVGRMTVDARNVQCAARLDGRTLLRESIPSGASCVDVFPAGAVVANGQYTPLSEVFYAGLLIFLLAGVIFLLRALDIGTDRRFVYALVPYMLFGSALRVVEDASNVAADAAGTTLFPFPWNVLVVAPIIYVTGAVLTIGVLTVAVGLERRGSIDDYATLTGAVGVALFALTVGVLVVLALTTDYVGFVPGITVVTVAVATALSAAVYLGIRAYLPSVVAGIGLLAGVVVWAHAIDGVANVLILDWSSAFGLQPYYPKHPINEVIVDVTRAVFPASVTGVIGDAWPFLIVKLVAATAITALFGEEFIEESPRYTMLILTMVILLGLGPGARDMIRATLGV
ncbi:MAG: DUF63 family protein [Salinirussus sp.]